MLFIRLSIIEQFPERKLWKAVILKAIADAQIKNPNKYEVLHKEQAKNWLLHDNKDFVLICELAGLNPITTRNKVKSLLLKQ